MRRAKLPTMLRDRPDAYLPQLPTLSFLKEMSRGESIEDFGLRALQRLRVRDLSELFAAAIYESPKLQAALEKFRERVYLDILCLPLPDMIQHANYCDHI